MQLSEQQINLLRKLLECVEYDPASPTQKKVHKALEALDGLRAQADARPHVATVRYSRDCDGDWHATAIFNGEVPEEGTKLYTHPEASAPGLSDAEILDVWIKHGGPLNGNNFHSFARAILTRASAATVAEPTVVQSVRICPISDVECAKKCGATCNHEAAQQQAEPGADEPIACFPDAKLNECAMLASGQQTEKMREAFEAYIMDLHPNAHEDVSKQRAGDEYIHQSTTGKWLAWKVACKWQARSSAQSGQRAGVAADAARFVFMIEGALADIRGDELTPQQQAMREALMHPELQTLDDVRARIDTARAAAPTQQQEGD